MQIKIFISNSSETALKTNTFKLRPELKADFRWCPFWDCTLLMYDLLNCQKEQFNAGLSSTGKWYFYGKMKWELGDPGYVGRPGNSSGSWESSQVNGNQSS